MAIKVIVDSASDISKEEAKGLGVIMVPLTVLFGNTEYLDGVDLLPRRFYEMLVESDELPKTSQITAYTFEEVFSEVVNNGDEAIVITLIIWQIAVIVLFTNILFFDDVQSDIRNPFRYLLLTELLLS